jgi:glutathione S-transferase
MLRSEREFHRKTAVRCFNETWVYLDKKVRTKQETLRMLQLAHASRYHWGIVGTPRNEAIGDWQISRVYAALKQPRLSLLFAKSSLEICKREKLPEILVTANEAVARAYAVAEDHLSARKYLKLAREQLATLSLGAQDRRVYLSQIDETEKLIAP